MGEIAWDKACTALRPWQVSGQREVFLCGGAAWDKEDTIKSWKANWAWRLMLVIPVLRKLRPELETSLGYNGFLLAPSLLVLIYHLLG